MCRGLHNRPHNKIVSTPVISTRSINARSRTNCIAQIKNNASKGIRFTRVIVVFNASFQPSQSNPSRVLLLPASTEVSVNADQGYKFIRLRLS
jgi:hypothetical protein